MNYLILFILVVISSEILIKFNYIFLVNSIIKLNIKAYKIILNKNVSDNWKEKIIPKYSIRILKISLSMILILFVIVFLFFMAGLFQSDFINFIFSKKGLIASILFLFGYVYSKKLFK